MNSNKRYFFSVIFFTVTILFSIIGFQPAEVIIIGPEFHEQEYFLEELDIISESLDIKIQYKTVNDPENYIIENKELNASVALIPNPQGVKNLAERGHLYKLNSLTVDGSLINTIYSDHLIDIVSKNNDIYAGWTRLFPNSLIWYDISKFEEYDDLNFKDFDSLISSTKKIADSGVTPWCANSESSASTGWIQTNWLEDIILSKNGPEVYDKWSQLSIQASNIKIFSSVKIIDDFIFYPNHIHNGPGSIISKEFRNLPKVLLDDRNSCFLSWSGHYFRFYIPDEYAYGKDYGVIKLPKITLDNTVVGIGDALVLIEDDQVAKNVISEILSSNFGEKWSSYPDTEFISANKYFNREIINNELTQYEFDIVHASLQQDLFRYDASEVMARPIGSNLLWKFFVNFIREGSESIVKLLNELDREI